MSTHDKYTMRLTMANERLNGLALMNDHGTIQINILDVIERLQKDEARM